MLTCFLDFSLLIVKQHVDTASLPQHQDRTPSPLPSPACFFPVGWKRQPEEGGIGPGCCGGGVITTWAAGDGVIAAGSAV